MMTIIIRLRFRVDSREVLDQTCLRISDLIDSQFYPSPLLGVDFDTFVDRLCGFPPFYDENNQTLFQMIKTCQFEFPSPYWDDISDLAKDLIKKLLTVDPQRRLDADGVMAHPWIRGEGTPREEMP